MLHFLKIKTCEIPYCSYCVLKHVVVTVTYFLGMQHFLNLGQLGCPNEQDSTWGIIWPATSIGEEAIQQCEGIGMFYCSVTLSS